MDSQKVVILLFCHSGLDPESSNLLWSGSRLPPGRRLDPGFCRSDGFGDFLRVHQEWLFIKTANPKSGQETAVALEKKAMLAFGSQFTFAMAMCVRCEACA